MTIKEPVPSIVRGVYAISADGNRVSWASLGPLPDATSGRPYLAHALAVRGAGEWVSRTNLPPFPNALDIAPHPWRFSGDFDSSLWQSENFGLSRRTPAGDEALGLPSFIGASADTQHVLVSSGEHLLPADASRSSGASLYEYVGSTLRLVDVDDSGTLLSDCGSTTFGANSISSDGRKVFFNASPGCAGPTRAFVRVDGEATRAIGASQCGLPDCGAAADVTLVAATPSGSSAYLLTRERLIDGDTDSSLDLYRFDLADARLTLISSREGASLLPSGEVMGSSPDGSFTYFRASEEVEPEVFGPLRSFVAARGQVDLIPGNPDSLELTADGHSAVYATPAAVVPADSDESIDIYRYSAEDGAATLLSTGSLGGNGPFEASIRLLDEVAAAPVRYRTMSDDGRRVFFQTAERLLPADRNEATDVYESTAGGLSLVSAGEGEWASQFFNTTPDGGTVIFKTADTLVPADRDGGSWDYYVARIGGGFPPEAPSSEDCDPCPTPGRGARTVPSAEAAAQRIRLRPIDAAARRETVASGWIELLAEVPKAGRLSAEARARVGRRERIVATASVQASAASAVRLRMRLSKGARQRLAAGTDLRVRLRLRLSGLDAVSRGAFALRAKP